MNILQYLLNHLQEECAEVIKASSKCSRFGLTSPSKDGKGMNNQEQLEDEVLDVLVMIKRLQDRGYIRKWSIEELVRHEMTKGPKGEKYMEISRELGMLHD